MSEQKKQGKGFNPKDRRPGKGFRGSDQKDQKDPRPNDVSWYSRSEQLLKDAASVAFASYPGSPVQVEETSLTEKKNLSGLAVVEFVPTLGVSRDASSPLNRASLANYSYVRHANSGSRNYEHPDLMIFNIAYMNALLGITLLRRVYGVSQAFYFKNRLLPGKLIEMLGFDSASISGSLADLRYRINYLTRKLSSIAIPQGFTILERWLMLCEHVFKDSDLEKAAVYCFNPTALYAYDATTDINGGRLVGIKTPTKDNPMDWSEWADLVEEMIDRIIADEDCGIMSGDQLKAYGQDKLIKFNEMPENYVVEPMYSKEILGQFHNLQICPGEAVAYPSLDFEDETPGRTYAGEIVSDSSGSNEESQALPSVVCVTQSGGILRSSLIYEHAIVRAGSSSPEFYYGNSSTSLRPTWGSPTLMANIKGTLLDAIEADVTPGAVMSDTRFKFHLTPWNSIKSSNGASVLLSSPIAGFTPPSGYTNYASIRCPFISTGTEICTSIILLDVAANAYITQRDQYVSLGYTASDEIRAKRLNDGKFIAAASAFDWFPILINSDHQSYYVSTKISEAASPVNMSFGGGNYVNDFVGDRNEYTVIAHNVIDKLNDVAVLSELYQPITFIG